MRGVDVAEQHTIHARNCWCLGDSARCCQPTCLCHFAVVCIAVGTLDREKFPGRAETLQRSPNFDTHDDAEAFGLRMLTEHHWSTFTTEQRYYRHAE